MGVAGRRALIPLMAGTLRGPPPANSTRGSVDVEGRGVLVCVRGGMFGKGGVPTYWARRLRTSGVREYGVPAGLPRDPGALRLLGVPTAADGEKRGLTMLTGRVGLVIVGVMVGWRREVTFCPCGCRRRT
jgi:hypothetical protein